MSSKRVMIPASVRSARCLVSHLTNVGDGKLIVPLLACQTSSATAPSAASGSHSRLNRPPVTASAALLSTSPAFSLDACSGGAFSRRRLRSVEHPIGADRTLRAARQLHRCTRAHRPGHVRLLAAIRKGHLEPHHVTGRDRRSETRAAPRDGARGCRATAGPSKRARA